MNNHTSQWQLLQKAWQEHRMPQALLFVGPLHCDLKKFTTQLIQLLLCCNQASNASMPCLQCIDCHMAATIQHPDLEWIKPEKTGAVIKIDSIRQLQQSAYLTPHRAKHRIIVIESAEKMNTAAANAVLKILEEPAAHTLFILLAEQVSTLLPTVLSRCHLLRFSSFDDSSLQNLLSLGARYPQDSERALMMAEAEPIMEDFIAMLDNKMHPCTVAAKWNGFDLSTLLWLLYLTFAQLLQMKHRKSPVSGPASQQLITLSSLLQANLIFKVLDEINLLYKKLNQNMNINQSLALENLLFSLMDNR
ncbi:MAG: DNA polymerase III subunit delta' [Legionella sp.]|nr:DNA polymerase III subunit delta' [Legionella sp.]